MNTTYEDISRQKEELRRKLLKERQRIKKETLRKISDTIFHRITQLNVFANANVVHTYLAIEPNKEVDTWNIIDICHELGKEVVVPVMQTSTNTLSHYRIDPDSTTFEKNKIGIIEPKNGEFVKNPAFDLILVPMIGGDWGCNRLGYGKGYYDRFLEHQNDVYTLGVMPDLCKVSEIPVEDHDVPLSGIVTESELWERE